MSKWKVVNIKGYEIYENADLRGASLNNTNLSGLNLSGCDLSNARLLNANLEDIIVDTRTNFTKIQCGDMQHQQIKNAQEKAIKSEQEQGIVTAPYLNGLILKLFFAKALKEKGLPDDMAQVISYFVFLTGLSTKQVDSINDARDQLALIGFIVNNEEFWKSLVKAKPHQLFGFTVTPPTFFKPRIISRIQDMLKNKTIPTELHKAIVNEVKVVRDKEQGLFDGDENDHLVNWFSNAVEEKTLSQFIEDYHIKIRL